MKRVTSIGGIFFKTEQPDQMRQWYAERLGLASDQYGAIFSWRRHNEPEKVGYSVLSPFKKDTSYFAPSQKDFMINFRVENLVELLEILQKEGVEIVGEIQTFEYGKFAWILDPEGNKIELWEPVDEEFTKMYGDQTTR